MRFTLLSGLVGPVFGIVLLAPAATAQHPLRPWKKVHSPIHRSPFARYVGPTVAGQACFGYFPTQWTQWEHVCPGGVGCDAPIPVPDAGVPVPAEAAPAPRPAEVDPAKPPADPKSSTKALPRRVSPIQPASLPPGLSDSQFAK